MGTVIRPEVSKKNQYYISKHRYYELVHFCLQYPEFKRKYNELCQEIPGGVIQINKIDGAPKPNRSHEIRDLYLSKMELIEECSKLTDPVLGTYILKGVTENRTYTYFKMNERIPCGKDMYYDLRRKFFWILDYKKAYLDV